MKEEKPKRYTLDEATDAFIGPKGTPERDKFEEELKTKAGKASQKYWDKNKMVDINCFRDDCLLEEHKEVYDNLVSLEAKIEELREFYREKYNNLQSNVVYMMRERLSKYESELSQLKEQHGL